MKKEIPDLSVENRIYTLRNIHVMIDADIAELFGVSTKRLNEQVKRNIDRFPEDFVIQMSNQEFTTLRSQYATAKWAKRRSLPFAFTEHGALMLANVVKSNIAINASISIVRAFVKTRKLISEHQELKTRLDEIERKFDSQLNEHEQELTAIRFAIHQLSEEPEVKKNPIGFRVNDENYRNTKKER